MSAKIVIQGSKQLIRGQKTVVDIVVNFANPTKVRGIYAVFLGREKTEASYTTTETDSDGDSKSVSRTATQHVEIVKQEFLLFGEERKGFFARISDSFQTAVGGGSSELIEPGEKQFSIDVMVPGGSPATMKGQKCEVSYELTVAVDIPIKIDWTETKPFVVLPPPVNFSDTQPAHVVYPNADGRSFWDKTFGKDVTMNLAVDRDKISVGEKALAMLTIDSPDPIKVKKIQCNLVGMESTEADGHTDSAGYSLPLSEIESPNILAGESVHEFEIFIEKLENPCTQFGTKFSVRWWIEVRLDIPWAKDSIIRVPIELHPPKPIEASAV